MKPKTSISEQELMGMASLGFMTTGIDDVIIWVGLNPGQQWKRIKVSNVANKITPLDLFILTIPDFKIIGNVDVNLLTLLH